MRGLLCSPPLPMIRPSIVLSLLLLLPINLPAQTPAASKAPAWDARGVGALPWQGVSAVNVSSDGRRVVVGTMAPADDPNVLVLDAASGKVAAQYAVGQRWIEAVTALPGAEGSVMALCTNADGTANDFPTVYLRGKESVNYPSPGRQEGFVNASFHYGDHSNHLGMRALNCTEGTWVSIGNSTSWYVNGQTKSGFSMNLPLGEDAVSTTAAALPGGVVVLGHAVPLIEGKAPPANVHVLRAGERKPLWARAALTDLPPVPAAEKGAYGAPTLRNGEKKVLKQWDAAVTGPLSIALHTAADGTLARVATADYRGWQRWVRSSATGLEQNNGTRLIPSKPVVSVYDGQGTLVRRFDAARFAEAAWLDLRFLPDGKRIVAWPHRWTSRGLGGVGFLPADPEARRIYLLDVESGDVRALAMSDAVADLALTSRGDIVVSCWDGGVYRFADANFAALPKPGATIGGAALLAVTGDTVIAARADGVVIGMNAELREQWRVDLNRAVPHAEKAWVTNAKPESIVQGLWGIPGGRVQSDLGGQRVIEAPDGLILIEAHAGLSFDREWAAIQKAGLDPMRVRYVLATHEHGDHSPGAYLWRVTTGAQFVCSEEMAYTLQHHIPLNTGYGFHPPVPSDQRLKEEYTDLTLAGLKVRAIKVPGHTGGSMAWSFEKDGKRFLSTGDLIMPYGPLGYSGSINFSARDVIASLKKLQAVNADLILPGHGAIMPPPSYLGDGIEIGERVGWGKIAPSRPDPRYLLKQANVIVAAWNMGAQSAAFGDFNADGRPDVAVVLLNDARDGAIVRLFYNRGGRFESGADREIALPGVSGDNLKIAAADLNGDQKPDLLVSGTSSALLLSKGGEFEKHSFSNGELVHAIPGAEPAKAPQGILVARRHGNMEEILVGKDGQVRAQGVKPEMTGAYVDLRRLDLNGDGKLDSVTSYGRVTLADGTTYELQAPDGKWRFFAVGDFNGDKRPDLFVAPYEASTMPAVEYLNTRDKTRPFSTSRDFAWPEDPKSKTRQNPTLIRETIAVGDWNGDGRDDLILAIGQSKEVHILPGSASGLDASKRQVIALEYHLHYETGLYVGDFNGDGKPDIASLGYTETGVGTSGPPSVYIWCQP